MAFAVKDSRLAYLTWSNGAIPNKTDATKAPLKTATKTVALTVNSLDAGFLVET